MELYTEIWNQTSMCIELNQKGILKLLDKIGKTDACFRCFWKCFYCEYPVDSQFLRNIWISITYSYKKWFFFPEEPFNIFFLKMEKTTRVPEKPALTFLAEMEDNAFWSLRKRSFKICLKQCLIQNIINLQIFAYMKTRLARLRNFFLLQFWGFFFNI